MSTDISRKFTSAEPEELLVGDKTMNSALMFSGMLLATIGFALIGQDYA